MPSLSPVEVTNAVGRAASAAKTFNKTSISQRKIILQSLLDWLVAESETLCRMAARDTGKTSECIVQRQGEVVSSAEQQILNPVALTVVDAFLGEILVTAEKLRWILANVDHVLADESRSYVQHALSYFISTQSSPNLSPSNPLLLLHKRSKVVYEPLGGDFLPLSPAAAAR